MKLGRRNCSKVVDASTKLPVIVTKVLNVLAMFKLLITPDYTLSLPETLSFTQQCCRLNHMRALWVLKKHECARAGALSTRLAGGAFNILLCFRKAFFIVFTHFGLSCRTFHRLLLHHSDKFLHLHEFHVPNL